MLKPRYNTLSESVSDFRRMLDGMNQVQPLEHARYEELDRLVREEQELERAIRALEHVERTLLNSGFPVSEAQVSELGQQYDAVADKLHTLANRAGRAMKQAKQSDNPALLAKMKEVHSRLRRKAKGWEKKTKRETGKRNLVASVNESLDPAPLSRYRSSSNALRSFRVLAGLEERTLMPRDAGLLGTTRFNQGYDGMVSQKLDVLSEAESSAHRSKMKAAARKAHQVGDTIDREYGEDDDADMNFAASQKKTVDEARTKEQQYAGLAALYRKHKADKTPIKIDPATKSRGVPLKTLKARTTATRRRRLDVAPDTVMKRR